MLARILVPLDGSTLSERALPVAVSYARLAGARLHLLLVHDTDPFGGAGGTPGLLTPRSAKEQYLDAVVQKLRAQGVSVTGRVVTGRAAREICSKAKRSRSDMVVMTTHGRTGFSRVWIGSVADAVVRRSCVPVLLVRAAESEPAKVSAPPQRIMVPLDGSAEAERILPIVASLARLTLAKVVLARVVEPAQMIVADPMTPYVMPVPIVDEDATRRMVEVSESYLQRVARSLAPVVAETAVIVHAHPVVALLKQAVGAHTDLIAMTTRGRGMSRLLIGSVADKMLRANTRPLLLYRPARRAPQRTRTTAASGTRRRALATV